MARATRESRSTLSFEIEAAIEPPFEACEVAGDVGFVERTAGADDRRLHVAERRVDPMKAAVFWTPLRSRRDDDTDVRVACPGDADETGECIACDDRSRRDVGGRIVADLVAREGGATAQVTNLRLKASDFVRPSDGGMCA